MSSDRLGWTCLRARCPRLTSDPSVLSSARPPAPSRPTPLPPPPSRSPRFASWREWVGWQSMRRGAAWRPRPAESKERGAAAPPAEEKEETLAPALALDVTRGCWTLNCLRGRMGSVGCDVLARRRFGEEEVAHARRGGRERVRRRGGELGDTRHFSSIVGPARDCVTRAFFSRLT